MASTDMPRSDLRSDLPAGGPTGRDHPRTELPQGGSAAAGPDRLGAISLVVAGALLAASAVLQPPIAHNAAARLADMQAAGARGALSAALFLAGQLPNLLAVVAIGRLVRTRSPRLAAWGAGLGVAGAFAEGAMGAVVVVFLEMAEDTAHRDVYAAFYDHVTSSPLMLIAVVGLVGTVVGLLLLSIALLRAQVGPRWAAPAVWAFLVLQFAGSMVSMWASYLSVLLLLSVYLALARAVLDPRRQL